VIDIAARQYNSLARAKPGKLPDLADEDDKFHGVVKAIASGITPCRLTCGTRVND
jgi:hypothetical protein